MRALWLTLALALATVPGALPAAAQQLATLLADSVRVEGNDALAATGNVEVLYGDARLRANSIRYFKDGDRLEIEGPIVLTQGEDVVILADDAQLTTDLRDGLLQSARMVLDQQLQLAAAEIARVDGRYTQLYKTVASSCRICPGNPVPLWQIRAEKVIHDQQARMLYFEGAQFMIGNAPVVYLPRLRMPDPTQTRATGFLVPQFRNSSRLGAGIKVPYFVTLGDSADITVTPYLSARTFTLEGRYRQAFRSGEIELNGAVSTDDLHQGTRSYLFAEGQFRLDRGFRLTFDAETTSDPSYLLDYGYSGKDRLDSEVAILRTREGENIVAGITHFRTLRGSELAIDDQLPWLQGTAVYTRRFYPGAIGGQGTWELALQGHTRASQANILGRDVLRFGASADWSREWHLGAGVLGRLGGAVTAAGYTIADDSTYPEFASVVVPALEADLRWPLVRNTGTGVAYTLEPVVQLAWSRSYGATVPNEDSTQVEFDQGNLFSLSRFPGEDRQEQGARAAAGLKWSRFDPDGWSLDLAVGRVMRAENKLQFSRSSGLRGDRSDWLVASQLKLGENLAVTARGLVHQDLTMVKAETRTAWTSERATLAATYNWIEADPQENRPSKTAQLGFDGSYAFTRHWVGSLDVRYDFDANKATRAGIGVQYRIECLSVDLSLSRRFTSSTSVKPSTDFNLSFDLLGFGSDGSAYRRNCYG